MNEWTGTFRRNKLFQVGIPGGLWTWHLVYKRQAVVSFLGCSIYSKLNRFLLLWFFKSPVLVLILFDLIFIDFVVFLHLGECCLLLLFLTNHHDTILLFLIEYLLISLIELIIQFSAFLLHFFQMVPYIFNGLFVLFRRLFSIIHILNYWLFFVKPLLLKVSLWTTSNEGIRTAFIILTADYGIIPLRDLIDHGI